MKASFLQITDKAKLMNQIESGDKEALKFLIRELDRLECLVRDYELSFDGIINRVESKSFKKPAELR